MHKRKTLLRYAVVVLVLRTSVNGLAIRAELPEDLNSSSIRRSRAKEERRGREREAPQRDICSGCNRPPVLCLCKALPKEKFRTKTKILILQHPNEFRKKTFSTVPLLSLVLEDVQVKVGYQFDRRDLPLFEQTILSGRRPLLLFPGEDAIAFEELRVPDVAAAVRKEAGDTEGPHNLLILLDGTWVEARRMASQSRSVVENCQHVTFSTNKACLYDSIRKEPDSFCFSTLEACARALEHLESAFEETRCLEDVLRLMIAKKLEMEAERPLEKIDDQGQRGRKRDRRMRHMQRKQQALSYRPEPRIIDQDTGAVLRALTVDDAKTIDANSYHPSTRNLAITKKRISNGFACFGIEHEGKLVAHIIRCEDGCLGMIHEDPNYQGKGYAELLLAEASEVLDRAGLAKMTLIKEGNTAMESLLQNAGWYIAEDKLIAHEGYLRRRWISSPLHRS